MPILWKTSTEGLDGSKPPFFNLRKDVSPSRRVPPPTKGRCGSRQNTVGTHERHIRPETWWSTGMSFRAFRCLTMSSPVRRKRRDRHYDVWSIDRNEDGTYFDSYKSLERMAAAAFYWYLFRKTGRYPSAD